jgi:hypothetical protein
MRQAECKAIDSYVEQKVEVKKARGGQVNKKKGRQVDRQGEEHWTGRDTQR